MSRRKKKLHGRSPHKPALTAAQKDELAVRKVATIYTCSSKMTHDFVHQLDDDLDSIDLDMDYTRLGLALWQGRPGHIQKITAILTELLAARERHRAEVADLRKRLADLMAVPHDEHLHPVENYFPLVRKHVITAIAD